MEQSVIRDVIMYYMPLNKETRASRSKISILRIHWRLVNFFLYPNFLNFYNAGFQFLKVKR